MAKLRRVDGAWGVEVKNLADEACRCGHLRRAHRDTTAPGHGACGALGFNGRQGMTEPGDRCSCERFTWAAEPAGGYVAA